MKKILILTLSFLCCTLNVSAQFSVGKTVGQTMVEESVAQCFFLSRQSFQISDKKNGDLYGFKGNEEFGIEYSLGVKILNGYILTDKAIRPWKYNQRYMKYEENYNPVAYTSKYSELGSKTDFKEISLEKPSVLSDSSLYLIKNEVFENKGLKIDTSEGDKAGWLVWVTGNSSLNFEKTSSLNFFSIWKSFIIEEKSKGKPFEVDAPKADSIIGAIYVIPEYTEIGTIVFKLCGLVVKKNGKWQLVCPFVGMTFDEDKGGKPQDDNVSNVNGDNRNDNEPSELTPIEKPAKAKGKKKKNKKD